MPSRKKTEVQPLGSEQSFESALTKLEAIVESMEGEQMPLEDLVSQYEAASVLLRYCESVLVTARERIEVITISNTREAGFKNHAPETSPSSTVGENDDDDDIRLF